MLTALWCRQPALSYTNWIKRASFSEEIYGASNNLGWRIIRCVGAHQRDHAR